MERVSRSSSWGSILESSALTLRARDVDWGSSKSGILGALIGALGRVIGAGSEVYNGNKVYGQIQSFLRASG
jgi:hypothetical protein